MFEPARKMLTFGFEFYKTVQAKEQCTILGKEKFISKIKRTKVTMALVCVIFVQEVVCEIMVQDFIPCPCKCIHVFTK